MKVHPSHEPCDPGREPTAHKTEASSFGPTVPARWGRLWCLTAWLAGRPLLPEHHSGPQLVSLCPQAIPIL